MNYERTPRERTPEQQRARMEPDRFYRPFNVPVVRQTTHPMTRIDEIRDAYEHPTAAMMPLRAHWADESIGYLLSLVERAASLMENLKDWQHPGLEEWFRDVRGEDTP